ncbi:excinuclease ABC subunit UvrA [bacterium]|nr:excinuclease ABC subunit UvrA [bacterium]
MATSTNENINLHGVRTNNLKNLDLDIPLGKLTVVTGVSGSGKSSLVFDTLYGESYRRYVDSLSSFARQYLKTLPRPDVDKIENLPSSIAVQQSRSGAGNRSTVGTLTELNDLLRLIFTHASLAHCPNGHGPIKKDTPGEVLEEIFENFEGQKIILAASLDRLTAVKPNILVAQLMEQGFVRVYQKEKLVRLEEIKEKDIHKCDIVIDRVSVNEDSRARIIDAIKSGFKLGSGEVYLKTDSATQKYSNRMECYECGEKVKAPSAALFNWNHPVGACPTCQGYGMEGVVDWEKVFPDHEMSLNDKGVKALNFGKHVRFYTEIKKNCEGILDPDKPFKSYTKKEWEWLKFGDKAPRKGKRKVFESVKGYFKWLDTKKYKAHYRMHAARFRKYILCTGCHGYRVKEDTLRCKISGAHIGEVSSWPISKLHSWIGELANGSAGDVSKHAGSLGVLDALTESNLRIAYMMKMGLGYLNLSRASKTLSGGELQRINMARCLGSALTQTMFCLDEPTAGLHARDSENLLGVLNELRDLGNTVVVVEHDPLIIRGADHVIEIGPEAGHEGGHAIFSGDASKTPILESEKYEVDLSRNVKKDFEDFIELKGADTHNLKSVDLKLPVGSVIGICGVSGSGKTSLVQHTLYPAICKALKQNQKYETSEPLFKSLSPSNLKNMVSEIDLVSQGSLGRSTRSTIATYLGLMNGIRLTFSNQEKAKELGLTPGHFSFNVSGGRCESCRGLGTVIEDLSFLGDMAVTCPNCNGKRFGNDVLEVKYKNKNLNDVLTLTIAEARIFFHGEKKVTDTLDHVIEMGLGYITLGQHTSSFSGGEAQRLKLLNMLKDAHKKFSQKPNILIFDEPTTGLSEKDVSLLIDQFRKLREIGHTVVIVEHHLGLLRSVDWLVEVGPESADKGGDIVYQGPPADLKSLKAKKGRSITAEYLY